MKKKDLAIGAEYARTSDGKLSGYHAERVRLVGFTTKPGTFAGDSLPVVEVVILDRETGEPTDIDFVTSEPKTTLYPYRQIASPWSEFVFFQEDRERRRVEHEEDRLLRVTKFTDLRDRLRTLDILTGLDFPETPFEPTGFGFSLEQMERIVERLEASS